MYKHPKLLIKNFLILSLLVTLSSVIYTTISYMYYRTDVKYTSVKHDDNITYATNRFGSFKFILDKKDKEKIQKDSVYTNHYYFLLWSAENDSTVNNVLKEKPANMVQKFAHTKYVFAPFIIIVFCLFICLLVHVVPKV